MDHEKKSGLEASHLAPYLKVYFSGQNYNFITQYLHSIRYHHLTRFLSKVVQSCSHTALNLFEIGCGYGKSLEAMKQMPHLKIADYLGINIEEPFTEFCNQKYPEGKYQFLTADIRNYVKGHQPLSFRPNAILSLECFEHIPEYDVPSIVEWLHSFNCPLFISVPNETGPAILLKNFGSYLMRYSRYKDYTWKETFNASRYHLEKVPAHGTGHIGFDWRWLAAVLNQKFSFEIGTSPWNFIPRAFSPSIYFYCIPRK